jgi:hypothetical protein
VLDASDLITVASIVAAFSGGVLFFRIGRELGGGTGPVTWIPWADRLVIASSTACLLLAILPLLVFGKNSSLARNVSTSVCVGSVLLLGGYIPAILAHYRLLFGSKRSGPRENPEPAERFWVLGTVIIAVVLSATVFLRNR